MVFKKRTRAVVRVVGQLEDYEVWRCRTMGVTALINIAVTEQHDQHLDGKCPTAESALDADQFSPVCRKHQSDGITPQFQLGAHQPRGPQTMNSE